jgi:uncharacterized protein (TIGR03382 family)
MKRWIAALSLLAVVACASSRSDDEPRASTSQALSFTAIKPLDTVYVGSAGAISVENDYLPQVVCCENGAAPKVALEAQAVMARTYMYFRSAADGMGTQAKPFTGTQSDQAYFCKTAVSQACKDAVVATKDQITAYTNGAGKRIANVSFFVDGPRPACLANKTCSCPKPAATTPMTPQDHATCDCFAWSSNGIANPAYVTYNWSRTGTDVEGSTIGSTSNESNRGCASQNIQACLAYAGWTYPDLLRFFYGQDIELVHPDGTLVGTDTDAGMVGPSASPDAGGASELLPATSRPSSDDGGGCSSSGGPPGSCAPAFLALLAAVRRRRR